ncbi:cytochrome c biogenesis protein ResB [Propionicimonas sp.]|uniref:cytochrome c biogenesis protein ResB n=1 Tax=Propionicimonas sp. TaxID=1955623 RepID=UPI0039E46205
MIGWLRFFWSTLTSMRTALILLFVLGVAAIPGSLLPQRPTNPVGVATYLSAHPDGGPWLDRLGFFDVFGSAWFAAIYLLLFISLIGCIIPRTATFARELRALPARAPGRLTRLPGHTTARVGRSPAEVLDAAEAHLRSRRYVVRRESDSISAERGRLREVGNLVFHICLVATLVGLAWGSLFSFKGTTVVVEGQAFSNTLTQYDEFGSGAAFNSSQLSPFTIRLDSFDVRFETGPVQTGAAREFNAHVTLSRPGQADVTESLQVNAPLQLGGDTVHLLGHGYAPVVTVRDGNGDVVFSGPVVFLPEDANFRSSGVIKAPDARPKRLAFEGVFLPTATAGGANGMVSAFPDALNPELLLNVWTGEPKVETGVPESVYSLDRTGLTQLTTGDGSPVSVGLKVGTGYKLPDGQGSITFDGWKRWTKLQISNTPGGWMVLGSVMLAVIGMAVSLTVRPRRLYVRVSPAGEEPEASTTVGVAGLDRVEGRGGLTDEVSALAAACGFGATLTATEDEEQQ